MLTSGIFYSKLEYCLPVFGNNSGMGKYGESSKMRGMTAADCNKLQVIQNSVNRKLFNKLPRTLREEKRTEVFKTELKIWVRRNVSIKPSYYTSEAEVNKYEVLIDALIIS